MGPFVPDLISEELNLIVALVLGIAFGVVLEQAGFSSSRRLAGVFYGYDLTVLRVFFTAAITAMAGVLLLAYVGLLDVTSIYVNPTWLYPAIVGGMIMGVGFILGGYCPGTSVCAAAIGKVDAMFFLFGGALGVWGYAEAYPVLASFASSSDLGPILVYDSIGIPAGVFAFALILIAVAAFTVGGVIERRVDPEGAPSKAFPVRWHRLAAAGVLALGVVLALMPDRKQHLIAMVSDPSYDSPCPEVRMTADELAFRLVDREPNVRLVDVRPAEAYAAFALPNSINLSLEDLFTKDAVPALAPRHVKKVLIGETEQDERIAGYLLKELGYENCVMLEGGIGEFRRTILDPGEVVSTGSRWDDDVNSFRQEAKRMIPAMIREQQQAATRQPKPVKKIKGGC